MDSLTKQHIAGLHNIRDYLEEALVEAETHGDEAIAALIRTADQQAEARIYELSLEDAV